MQCLPICIVSTLLLSQSRALVIWSHPELEPGEIENLTLDKSFPLQGPQSPHWKKGDGGWGGGPCAARFLIRSTYLGLGVVFETARRALLPNRADEDMEALGGEVTGPTYLGHGAQRGWEGHRSQMNSRRAPHPGTYGVCGQHGHVLFAHHFTHFLPAFTHRPHQLLTAALGAEPSKLSTCSYPYYPGKETEAQRDDMTKNADPADLRAGPPSEYI